jgi:predicted ATPase/transcriptional regulator with XRE-family HTH domain
MIEEVPVEFGRLLRDHRLAAGLTQEALAERARMGVRSLQALERGESRPLRDTLQRLASALALTPAERAPFTAAAGPTPRRRAPAALASVVPSADGPPSQVSSPAPPVGIAALPVPLTSFVGREREMIEIAQLLERARLLTLTGPGGVGKTRLALQVAAAARPRFAGDVAFVSLAAIGDPTLVAATIATELDVQQSDDPSLARALIGCLHARRLLLVLDNFEHVVAAVPVVADLLAGCPALTIMVTSRMPLHLSGEQEYPVPPLAVPADDAGMEVDALRLAQSPAVALFVQRARLVRPEFALTAENAPVVGEICRRLDGLPLAIELAAARIKLLAPAALLARLDERLQVLKGGPQDLPERQQTLRGTMDWSYDLLSAAEQTLLRRLSVFSGGWTLEAAEAVCGGDDPHGEVLDILGSLVDRSLLVVQTDADGETRYGMLETIRVYALERLRIGGEDEDLQRRHAAHFEQLAVQAAPEPGWKVNTAWMAWTEREHDNLRAALQWAYEHGEAVMEMRLIVPLTGHCYAHRQLRDAREQLERLHGLQESYRDLVPPDLLLRALGALAGMLWLRGEYARARALAEESLARCGTTELAPYRKTSLEILGHIACETGDYARAAALFQELLERACEAHDSLATALALLGLSDVARGRGDADQIVARCQESLALSRAVGDDDSEGFALHNLGVAAYFQHDLPRADALLASSLALFRERGATMAVAEVLTSVGRLARAQGHLHEARSAFVESMLVARAIGPFFVVPDDLAGLAGLAMAQHNAEPAARLFGAVEALRGASGILPSALCWARGDRDLAAARAALGDVAFAAAYRAGQSMRLDDAIRLALASSALVAVAG